MSRILVAGVGNIFMGDDAFGVEVVQRLAKTSLPDGVRVVDFGIRGIDLAYALLDGYDAAILVDTAQLDAPPGTVRVVAPELHPDEPSAPEGLLVEPHDLDPAKVLRLAATLGDSCQRILLVACQPATFGDDDADAMGLSPAVAAAVDDAATIVLRLISDILGLRPRPPHCTNGFFPAQNGFENAKDPSHSGQPAMAGASKRTTPT
jgi:hydrogenase maturation protease